MDMLEKVKSVWQKHKTKAMVAVGSAAATMGSVAPVAFASDNQQAGIITNPVGTADMWATLGTGAVTFITGILLPVANFCTSNGICLAFLTVTFVGLGIRILRRAIGAFGRGR